MSEELKVQTETMFDAVHKSQLRERIMERVLPEVLTIPEEYLPALGAPERGKEIFRRACVAEHLASAAIYLCEKKYLDDRDGWEERKERA